ncbi:hypothetical protein NDU88_004671 [Pleurodeles waltl]|uniref:Uncharacterized protein n=1 Tax=Pleurodeles waltl TaxID=8319 RepID=A0AAV7LKI5_PLEWA|nr:hypothetical protein NDU88_004671 [Pleurodeles waltl]
MAAHSGSYCVSGNRARDLQALPGLLPAEVELAPNACSDARSEWCTGSCGMLGMEAVAWQPEDGMRRGLRLPRYRAGGELGDETVAEGVVAGF